MFIHNDWEPILKKEWDQPYMQHLFNQLHEQYEKEKNLLTGSAT